MNRWMGTLFKSSIGILIRWIRIWGILRRRIRSLRIRARSGIRSCEGNGGDFYIF